MGISIFLYYGYIQTAYLKIWEFGEKITYLGYYNIAFSVSWITNLAINIESCMLIFIIWSEKYKFTKLQALGIPYLKELVFKIIKTLHVKMFFIIFNFQNKHHLLHAAAFILCNYFFFRKEIFKLYIIIKFILLKKKSQCYIIQLYCACKYIKILKKNS